MEKTKEQLPNKLFFTYTAVLVVIVGILMIYFITSTRTRILNTNLDYLEKMEEEVMECLREDASFTSYFHGDLYRSSTVMEDMENYLKLDAEGYLSRHLDDYAASNRLDYRDLYDYVEGAFEVSSQLQRVEIISTSKGTLTECYRDGSFFPGKDAGERIQEIRGGTTAREREIAFPCEIRDAQEGETIGYLLLIFSTELLEEIQARYEKNDLILFQKPENIVLGGDKDYVWEKVLYTERRNELEEELRAYIHTGELEGYRVLCILDRDKAAQMPWPAILTILGIGAGLFLLGELLVRLYLHRLTARLVKILEGMHRVTTGDLKVRLPYSERGDELDVISKNFNDMCENLDRYIQKSYLAEIEQKNAEMQALQNQINPHFLYNTLEAIRMKAICNGDREVGKMLYSMAVTFRAQLKEADVITLMQELHYCEKYLELFQYRYQGRFTSGVECPFELANVPIIKFVLQPLIENYFVHGIRMDREDNFIQIRAERVLERVRITLEDNGYGMKQRDMEKKNQELRENKRDNRSSIGLDNVNSRVKAVYGNDYGVCLRPRPAGGMCVVLEIKYEEGKNYEDSHACGG